jgi:hypothetical protein
VGNFQSAAPTALAGNLDVGKLPPLVDSNELFAAPKVVCITVFLLDRGAVVRIRDVNAMQHLVMLADRPIPQHPLLDVSAGNNRFHVAKRVLVHPESGDAIVFDGSNGVNEMFLSI